MWETNMDHSKAIVATARAVGIIVSIISAAVMGGIVIGHAVQTRGAAWSNVDSVAAMVTPIIVTLFPVVILARYEHRQIGTKVWLGALWLLAAGHVLSTLLPVLVTQDAVASVAQGDVSGVLEVVSSIIVTLGIITASAAGPLLLAIGDVSRVEGLVVTSKKEASSRLVARESATSPSIAEVTGMAEPSAPVRCPSYADVLTFLHFHTTPSGRGRVSAAELHGALGHWCRAKGKKPMSRQAMGAAMTALGTERIFHRGRVVYCGLQLKLMNPETVEVSALAA
jgi:hypothetical protein